MGDPKITPAIGTINGVNKIFQTPIQYIPGTVWAYLDGVIVDRDDSVDGLIENSDRLTIEMRTAPRENSSLMFWFNTTVVVFPGLGKPPRLLSSINIAPDGLSVENITPDGYNAERTDSDPTTQTPWGMRAINDTPQSNKVLNLVPKPINAEEI